MPQKTHGKFTIRKESQEEIKRGNIMFSHPSKVNAKRVMKEWNRVERQKKSKTRYKVVVGGIGYAVVKKKIK